MKTKLVCHKCGADWGNKGSPAVCTVCNQPSAPINVIRKGGKKKMNGGIACHSK